MEDKKEKGSIDLLGKRGLGIMDIGFRNSYEGKVCAAPGESKHKCTRKPKKKVKNKKTHRKK